MYWTCVIVLPERKLTLHVHALHTGEGHCKCTEPLHPCAPPPASSPPPPSCNPDTYPYVNLTYYNPRECRTYTLFDVNAGCMPHWDKAKRYCEGIGQELAPWGDSESEGACVASSFATGLTGWGLD